MELSALSSGFRGKRRGEYVSVVGNHNRHTREEKKKREGGATVATHGASLVAAS